MQGWTDSGFRSVSLRNKYKINIRCLFTDMAVSFYVNTQCDSKK